MADRELKKTVQISGPTVVRTTSWEFQQTMVSSNQSQIDLLLATILPEIYVIWQNLIIYRVNPEVIPVIIKAIGDISTSSKLGEVVVEIRPDRKTGDAIIQRVRSVDTRHLELPAIKTGDI